MNSPRRSPAAVVVAVLVVLVALALVAVMMTGFAVLGRHDSYGHVIESGVHDRVG